MEYQGGDFLLGEQTMVCPGGCGGVDGRRWSPHGTRGVREENEGGF